MISKEKVKEILTNLKEEFYSTEEDLCDFVINNLYNMQANDQVIAYVKNLLINLQDETFDLFESALEEIKESK